MNGPLSCLSIGAGASAGFLIQGSLPLMLENAESGDVLGRVGIPLPFTFLKMFIVFKNGINMDLPPPPLVKIWLDGLTSNYPD